MLVIFFRSVDGRCLGYEPYAIPDWYDLIASVVCPTNVGLILSWVCDPIVAASIESRCSLFVSS